MPAELARVCVKATGRQVDQLQQWASPFGERVWAIESAGGLGYLLSQQLVDAGEQVFDGPATLAARVRLLGSGRSNKNDPNDARSRSRTRRSPRQTIRGLVNDGWCAKDVRLLFCGGATGPT